jgi:hypothetical protein
MSCTTTGSRIWGVFFELRDAIALRGSHELQPGRGSRVGDGVVRTSRRSNYVACITVNRTSPADVGFREVFLFVDDVEVAMLRHGESVTHELPAGPHRLRAHNTLFRKTHDIVLQPGEHARFTAVNRAGWGTFGLLMLLGAAPLYLTFERDRDG